MKTRICLLLGVAVPIFLCQCDGGARIADVRDAAFPEFNLPPDSPVPHLLVDPVVKGKTWGEVLSAVSGSEPEWSAEGDLVLVSFAVAGESGTLEFRDGHAVKVGGQATTDSEVAGVLAVMLYGKTEMESGSLFGEAIKQGVMGGHIREQNREVLKAYYRELSRLAEEGFGIFPENVDGIDAGLLTNPETGEKVRPTYYSGLNNSTNAGTPLMAAPFVRSSDGTRLILHVDGSISSKAD